MRRMALFGSLLACVSSTARADAPAASAPTPLLVLSPPSTGFIDDAFAIRADGKAVAYVTTDGASSAALHVAELGGVERELPGLPVTVSAIHWLGPDRLLVVARDLEHQTLTAQVYGPKGPTKEKLGPVDAIALATVHEKPAVVSYTRSEKRGTDHQLVVLDGASWKPIAKKTLHADAEGRIAQPAGPFKALWWHEGYTVLATLKSGEFDKARDLRRPDRFAQLEVFDSKLRDEHEIEDVLAFTQVATEHKSHADEDAFVHLSEDHRKLLLTDGLAEHELTLQRPLGLYEAETLAYQTLDTGRVAVSMTVDPVNPAALKRQKADPDELEIYFVDRRTRATTLELRLAGQGRPSAWRIAGGRIGVLRKSKGFDRGGVALEIYDLGGAQTSAPPAAH